MHSDSSKVSASLYAFDLCGSWRVTPEPSGQRAGFNRTDLGR